MIPKKFKKPPAFFKKEDWFLILFFLFVFILIRSLNFSFRPLISADSASEAISALEIWQQKKLVLVGPPISFSLNGRYFFHSSATYYLVLFFLLLAGFNYYLACYFFMLFCALMIIPLYIGCKMLIDKKAAVLMLIFYSLFPLYLNYTVTFWNPNFQLSLLPILILLLGLYKQSGRNLFFFLIWFCSGFLLLFHYQFILIIFGLLIYYFLIQKKPCRYLPITFIGIALGFSSMIFFELRNHFYNVQTLVLYLRNFQKVFLGNAGASTSHYYLSISFFIFLIFAQILSAKISIWGIKVVFCLFFLSALLNSISLPQNSQRYFTYAEEAKINRIIQSQKIDNYNVTDLAHDNVAVIQKYFLKLSRVSINYDDYYHNQFLFVVNHDRNFGKYSAYEMQNFLPAKTVKIWKINSGFNLYLLKRINKT